MPASSWIFLADSKLGDVAANAVAHCCVARCDVPIVTGNMTNAKNTTTITTKMAIMPSMMASNLENMEGCHPAAEASLSIATPNKKVAGTAHRADESRAFGIVSQLLP